MKKIIFLFLFISIMPIFSFIANAEQTNDKIPLFADKSFKEEILKPSENFIRDNSLFVSPDGDDNSTGTEERPFKTVQKALDTVKSGQTIYLRSGTYSGFNKFKASGNEKEYITLRNYPDEKPVLTGLENKSGAVLDLNSACYIRIEGLEICDFKADKAYGILLDSNENNIIIKNNNIHHISVSDDNSLNEANAVLCLGDGKTEELSVNNICIEGNSIHDNDTGRCEAISVAGNAKNINIINNNVYNNTNIGIDFYGNAGYCPVEALDQPRFCLAYKNTVYGNKCSYAECAGIYADGARDIIIEDNIVYNNMYGIEVGSEELKADYPCKNISVIRNTIYGNPFGGIRIGGYDEKTSGVVTDCEISENKIESNSNENGGICFGICSNITIKENIISVNREDYPIFSCDLPSQLSAIEQNQGASSQSSYIFGTYTKNISFIHNTYYSPSGSDNIYFEFGGQEIYGIDDFNSLTKGNDSFLKPDFSFSKGAAFISASKPASAVLSVLLALKIAYILI